MNLKTLEKQAKPIPQNSRQREITKIRAEINDIEINESIKQKIIWKKCQTLGQITQREKKAQINKTRVEEGDTITDTEKIHISMRK